MDAIELTDNVIILRPMTLDDAATHLAGEDELTVRFLSGGRSSLETVCAQIERNRRSWEVGGPIRCFGIREAATGELIGIVEANVAAPGYRSGVANISYGLYPHARGRGFVTRAVRLMVRHLTENSIAAVAVIQVDPENQDSARVPPRLGFRLLGTRDAEGGSRMTVFGLRLAPAKDALTLCDVCGP